MNSSIAEIVLLAWIFVVLGMFCCLTPRRAVITAFLAAWLFLPVAGIKLAPGIPVYDKMTATCAGVLIASLLFDSRTIATYRPSRLDIPMLVLCVCPFVTSIANDLGPYDGLSAAFAQIITWGVPYFIGRLYIRDLPAASELAIGLFISGLVYVPLCLIEVRLSPQLHNWIYGFQQHSFAQTIRHGGWRPMVFMSHGIMVGMWMSITGLIGLWLWLAGLRTFRGFPVILAALAIVATAILCRSTGAIVLMVAGIGTLFLAERLRWRGLIWALIAIAPMYMIARGSGSWDGNSLREAAEMVAGPDRAGSLDFRMKNEDMLSAKAREHPLFGWGGWARNRVFDSRNRDLTVTDGTWIITFGTNGLVGLAAWTLALLLPPLCIFGRFRPGLWRTPEVAPAIVLALVSVLHLIDSVPNAMTNPVFTLCLGGLATLGARSFACGFGDVLRGTQIERIHPTVRSEFTMRRLRILYAAGPGDVIGSYEHWKAGRDDPREVSGTYSGQFFTLCREMGCVAHVLVQRGGGRTLTDGDITIQEMPTPFQHGSSAIPFHMGQLLGAIRLCVTAVRMKADVAIVSEGTHWFALTLLKCLGIHIIPDLHCALWPMGYRNQSFAWRMITKLNGWFWAHIPSATLCVSLECERQVAQISRNRLRNPIQFRPSYRKAILAGTPPPDTAARPFVLLYAGRVERNKGVFDLVSVMGELEKRKPGAFSLVVCGGGGAAEALAGAVAQANLRHAIRLAGQMGQDAMRNEIALCHAMIVPTTASFVEGFNRVTIEAVLAGRPIVVTSVCPAWELVESAAIVVPPSDVSAMRDAALRLEGDHELYESKRKACASLAGQFYDSSQSWEAAAHRALQLTFPIRTPLARSTQPT